MILFKNILAIILKNNLDFFSRLFFKIILPKSWKIILNTWPVAAVRGGFGGGGGPPRRPTGIAVVAPHELEMTELEMTELEMSALYNIKGWDGQEAPPAKRDMSYS